VMSERQGIEIDYCPNCRGVWLDRGELDKLIDKSIGSHSSTQQMPNQREVRMDDDYKYGYKKKKREGFLGDLFDF
jgi:uncharacterized protein